MNELRLPNDTKIRFCNAMDALRIHSIVCEACSEYYLCGEGDLCEHGKDIIAMEMAWADTSVTVL